MRVITLRQPIDNCVWNPMETSSCWEAATRRGVARSSKKKFSEKTRHSSGIRRFAAG